MRLGIVIMAVLGSWTLACGSDDGGGADTTSATETTATETTAAETTATETTATETGDETTPTPQPGRILVVVTNLTGWQGKALVALTPDNKARLCAPITSDPFSLAATPLTAMDNNPCGPASADVVFAPGTHVFTLAVVSQGAQGAEASAVVSVEVDGDVTVTVDGSQLQPATGSAGKITIDSTPISGQADRIVILSVQSATAGACVAVDNPTFTMPSTTLLDLTGASNPCAGTGGTKTFAPGAYIVTAGVYVPGEHTPTVSTAIAVQVDGDITATIDGTKLSK